MSIDEDALVGARNPVDGDPDAVDQLVRELAATARELQDQATETGSLGRNETWQGPAGDAFREAQQEIPDTLGKLATRFEKVSAALAEFSKELRIAQEQAANAQRVARIAADARYEATRQLRWEAENPPPPDAPPAIGPDWHARHDAAEAQLADARRTIDSAILHRDDAARTAATRIRDACDDGLQNEGGLKGWLKYKARGISERVNLKFVATALGYLGLALGLLGLFLTGPIGWVAFGVGALSLAANTTLWVAGEASGADVLWDLFGVATFGLGRVVTAGAKTARAAKALKLVKTSKSSKYVRFAQPGRLKPLRVPKSVMRDVAAQNGGAVFTQNVKQMFGKQQVFKELAEFKDIKKWFQLRKLHSPPELPGIPRISHTGAVIEAGETVYSLATGAISFDRPAKQLLTPLASTPPAP